MKIFSFSLLLCFEAQYIVVDCHFYLALNPKVTVPSMRLGGPKLFNFIITVIIGLGLNRAHTEKP